MHRRQFLVSALAGLAWVSARPATPSDRLFVDVDCPEHAFDEIRQGLLAQWRAKPDSDSDAEYLRRGRAWLGGPLQQRVAPNWKMADGVPVYVSRPQGGVRAVVVEIHGGGWVMGNGLSFLPQVERLTEAGIAVVSLDYRLAPEHPYPAAVEDCVAATRWLMRQLPTLFGCERLCLLGFSAGSHLAACTLLRLLSLGESSRLAGAALYYGIYDLGLQPRIRQARDEQFPDLTPTAIRRMVNWFAPGLTPAQRQGPLLSPLYAPLTAIPPVLMLVGGGDPLLDDTLQLAQRWSTQGRVQVALYAGAPHGFNAYSPQGVEDSLLRVRDFILETTSA